MAVRISGTRTTPVHVALALRQVTSQPSFDHRRRSLPTGTRFAATVTTVTCFSPAPRSFRPVFLALLLPIFPMYGLDPPEQISPPDYPQMETPDFLARFPYTPPLPSPAPSLPDLPAAPGDSPDDSPDELDTVDSQAVSLITSDHYRFRLTGDSAPNYGYHILDQSLETFPVAALSGFEYADCTGVLDAPRAMEVVSARNQDAWYIVHRTEGTRKCDELRVVVVFFHTAIVNRWSRPVNSFHQTSMNMERMEWD